MTLKDPLTLGTFPVWSCWMREYGPDFWMLFVVEEHISGRADRVGDLKCRVLATGVPIPTSLGTLSQGSSFTFSSACMFASLCQRLA